MPRFLVGAIVLLSLSFFVPRSHAVWVGNPPSYPSYSTDSIVRDFNNRMNDRYDSYQRESEMQNLRWRLDDLNSNIGTMNRNLDSIRRQQSFDSISSLIQARSNLLSKLQSMGLQAFYATKKAPDYTPTCPANSSILLTDYCQCKSGYVYDLLGKIRSNSQTPCLASSLYKASISTPTPKPTNDCPLYSKRSSDGKTCICDKNYQPDPTEKYCVRIRKKK